ncbi:MAG: penicillin-binding transpeptidase domain-containing protein [Bacilli bacterium]|nr:penicillin-binding transpeptidase domain-containing protein [Bacilli bacterium]
MEERTRKSKINWYMVLFSTFLFFIVIVYVKYIYVALSPSVNDINLKEFASNRNTFSTTLYANRGTIYDKEGNTLALNIVSYTVIAYLSESRTGSNPTPLHVVDIETTAEKLSPILNMTEETLVNLLSKKAYQVELGPGGRGITVSTKKEIEALELPGIGFIENYKRYYPNGDFASYVIGYARQYEEEVTANNKSKINYKIVGELGIESKYEDILKGTNGYLQYEQDRFGYKIPDTPEDRKPAIDGNNIYLTLDSNIQRFVETAVKESARTYNPEWINLTVMDAKTGDILGNSSMPSFNPNIKDIKNYENHLVSYLYEPGSTMKIYTYMCAMESGKYVGSDTFKSGTIQIGDKPVNDWNGKGWGVIDYDKGFEYSSNVAIANLVQNVIDKNDLRDCLTSYGFSQKTDIELPRELVGSLNFNYPIEVVTAGFGQGITTTAIQQLQALTIIANNGSLVKPHIVDKIVNPNNNSIIYKSKLEKGDPVVSAATIQKIKALMSNTIYGTGEGTTGTAYAIPNFDIIGKTGTSQIYDNKLGKYLTGYNDYIYSFAGMFPKDDPEIIVYASMKKPTWGSSAAINVATKEVIKNTAKYLNIFGEQAVKTTVQEHQMKSYYNKKLEDVVAELEAKQIEVIVLGSGDRVIEQYPKPGVKVLSHDKVILLTNGNDLLMPDITNWSKSNIIALCNLIKIDYEFEGYGYAVNQSISINKPILDEPLRVVLKQKYQSEIDNNLS